MIKTRTKKSGIVILGATGSVGAKALTAAASLNDRYTITGISAGKNTKVLRKQIEEFEPKYVAVSDAKAAARVKKWKTPARFELLEGKEGVTELASIKGADAVFNGISGIAGLAPTLSAINAGRRIMTANKESLVAAGPLIMKLAREKKAKLIPVDSEHSAVFQTLAGLKKKEVRRIVLTASGGPFLKRKNLADVTPEEALAHPRWNMGRKTSVDSATLMNKGLEIIEAAALFGLPPEKIDVVIHPESIIHSMVELVDGSVIAHLAPTDMLLPIRYAMTYPDRLDDGETGLDIARIGRLNIAPPNEKKFPCLALARSAAEAGGIAPAAISAADEVAVEAFLAGKISFPRIADVVSSVLDSFSSEGINKTAPRIDDIYTADNKARSFAAEAIKSLG